MNIILYKLKLTIIFYYNWTFYMESSIYNEETKLFKNGRNGSI